MEMLRSKVMGFVGKRDNVINLFLLGSFVALGFRSSQQQQEIEALEAEKSTLRSGNKAMSSAMWEWRQHLFNLAEADPSSLPIPISKLRAIYGEDEVPVASQSDQGLLENEGDPVPIA